jgi:hypothetical protein
MRKYLKISYRLFEDFCEIYQRIMWSRVLEKLIVVEIIGKFIALYGSQGFSILFTKYSITSCFFPKY